MLAGTMLEETFLGAIVSSTRQARQPDQQRNFVESIDCCLGGQEEVEAHLAARRFSIVSKLQKLASEASDRCLCCDGHHGDPMARIE